MEIRSGFPCQVFQRYQPKYKFCLHISGKHRRGGGGAKNAGEGDAKQSPDVRHLLSHLACRFQPDYTFIPPQWQMCQRCAGPADVPHCAFSPFFRPRMRHITPCHMEMQGALTFLYNCQGSVRGVTSKNYLHRILLHSIQRSFILDILLSDGWSPRGWWLPCQFKSVEGHKGGFCLDLLHKKAAQLSGQLQ